MRRVAIAVIALGVLPACGTPHSQLQRVILWQGEADCTACQAQAVTLWPDGPPGLTLKANSVYTAQLELDTPGDPDRCVFQFASGTWELPSHSFRCDIEQPVMRLTLNTRRFQSPPTGDWLAIRVSVESLSTRTQVELLLDTRRFDVNWVP